MILTFGNTIRAQAAFFITNTTSGSLWIPFIREMLQAGQTRQMSFLTVDHAMRGLNLREGSVNQLNGTGSSYLDDLDQFCKLVTGGSITVQVAANNSGVLSSGTAAAYTNPGDGSVVFN